jgi:hypothetical protein
MRTVDYAIPYLLRIEGAFLKRQLYFVFALTVVGSTLTGCAVYPEGPVVIAPAEHQRGHHDQDEDEEEDNDHHRKHDRDHERDYDNDHEDN